MRVRVRAARGKAVVVDVGGEGAADVSVGALKEAAAQAYGATVLHAIYMGEFLRRDGAKLLQDVRFSSTEFVVVVLDNATASDATGASSAAEAGAKVCGSPARALGVCV